MVEKKIPLHKTTILKTLIRNNPIFAQKLGQNDHFVQFFNNQQNLRIVMEMQPNYLGGGEWGVVPFIHPGLLLLTSSDRKKLKN